MAVSALGQEERDAMFALFERYFHSSRPVFDRDLDEKESAVILTDSDSGSLAGFSTLLRLELEISVNPVTVFFSGDTVVDRPFWGSTELPRLWSQHVFRLAALLPGHDVFWFLISSGFRSYRYLPLFFRQFLPKRGEAPSPQLQEVLDHVARARFGERYDADKGIVRLEHRTPLRPGISDPGPRELRDPEVRFFLESNPRHAEGDELACLVRIVPSNLTRAGQRMVRGRG